MSLDSGNILPANVPLNSQTGDQVGGGKKHNDLKISKKKREVEKAPLDVIKFWMSVCSGEKMFLGLCEK